MEKSLLDLKNPNNLSYENIDFEVKGELYNYQKHAAYFMFNSKKCLNTFKTGLGKTISSLAVIPLIKKEKGNVKVALIVPSTLVEQWRNEIRNWLDIQVIVVEGDKTLRDIKYNAFKEKDSAILLFTYDKIKHDLSKIEALTVDLIICDECTILRDIKGFYHNSLKTLISNTERVLFLSGTPINTSFVNLYVLFKLLIPSILLKKSISYDYFSYLNEAKIATFKEIIDPYYIVAEESLLKQDLSVESTNPITFKVFQLPITEEQRRIFIDLKRQANTKIKNKSYNSYKTYSEVYKVCYAPCISDNYTGEDSPKLNKLLEILPNLEGQKTIVYIKFIKFIDLVKKVLVKNNFKFMEFSGRQQKEDRDEVIKDFNTSDSKNILLMTGAGKLGLNLQVANNVIFLDIPPNPADVLQFIGRVNRIGQNKDLAVYFMFMKNTIEEDKFRELYTRQSTIDTFFNTSFKDVYVIEDTLNFRKGFLNKIY